MFPLFRKVRLNNKRSFASYILFAALGHIIFAIALSISWSPTPQKPLLPHLMVNIALTAAPVGPKTTRKAPQAKKKDGPKANSPTVTKKAKVIAPTPKTQPKKAPQTTQTVIANKKTTTPPKKELPPPKKQEIPEQEALSANDILKNLAQPPSAKEKEEVKEEVIETPHDIADTLTLSELDTFRQQLSRCWVMPINSEQNIPVTILVSATPEGKVESTKVIEPLNATHPDTAIAINNAQRTFHHPDCIPLSLPKERYNQWKTFHITFQKPGDPA